MRSVFEIILDAFMKNKTATLSMHEYIVRFLRYPSHRYLARERKERKVNFTVVVRCKEERVLHLVRGI